MNTRENFLLSGSVYRMDKELIELFERQFDKVVREDLLKYINDNFLGDEKEKDDIINNVLNNVIKKYNETFIDFIKDEITDAIDNMKFELDELIFTEVDILNAYDDKKECWYIDEEKVIEKDKKDRYIEIEKIVDSTIENWNEEWTTEE